jgi:hypothetical protein
MRALIAKACCCFAVCAVLYAGNGPHQPDQSRSEDDAVQSYGVDDRGSIRDWNEEIQRCVYSLILCRYTHHSAIICC